MVRFPNAKINLGLHVTAKRQDGFHDLETVFVPIPVRDAVEVIPSPARPGQDPISFSQTGLSVAGKTEENTCVRAWHLLHQDYPGLPTVRIHLHKVIPTGAGLGGGSADGTFMLQMLNDLFALGISNEELAQYALQLGSDCPFFLQNRPCLAFGRGEILEPVDIDLSGYSLLLIHPGIHVQTAAAFTGIKPAIPTIPLGSVIRQPVSTWRDRLSNDFEQTVFAAYPEIARIKELLYELGAVFASMTGTGSAVYGLFSKGKLPEPALPTSYHVFRCKELQLGV